MHLHLSEVDSTNTVAKHLLKEHPAVIVTADFQTAGRGRNGRTWEGSACENIFLTYGYRHTTPPHGREHLRDMALASLSVLNVVRALDTTHQYRIKYPNDVQAFDKNVWKKLSGVLVEHEFAGSVCTTTVVGVGVNIQQGTFPDTITQPCTSLKLLGIDATVADVRDKLIATIRRVQQESTEQIISQWFHELNLVGRIVQVVGSDGDWKILGFDDNGRVRVQHNDLLTTRFIDDGDSIRYND